MGWNLFKRRPPREILTGTKLLDAVLNAAIAQRREMAEPFQERYEHVVQLLAGEPRRIIASENFVKGGQFVEAFGLALGQTVPNHVAAIICTENSVDASVEEHSDLVFNAWRSASDDHVRDLAALIAWRHALASFNDVNEIFTEEKTRRTSYETLMAICGGLFPPSDRAAALCRGYSDSLEGGYRRLGGGTIDEGGTYFVHGDSPMITTHAWYVNAALDGPSLDINVIDLAGVFYIQTLLVQYLTAYTSAYRETARSYLT